MQEEPGGGKLYGCCSSALDRFLPFGAAKSVQDFLEDKMNSKWVQLVEVSWPKACNDQLQLDPAEIFFQELHGQFNVEEVKGAIVTQNMKFYDDQAKRQLVQGGFCV